VSIGSSCNVCTEDDERRAAILKCTLDGKDCKVFAKGLRNAVGMVFIPLPGICMPLKTAVTGLEMTCA